MIIKVLEPVFKNVTSETEEVNEIIDRLVSKRMEIIEITEYSELINQRTKKPYKKRCLLRSMDQWLIVNHSFDDLTKMKNSQSRIVVKGFLNEASRQGSTKANRSSKS